MPDAVLMAPGLSNKHAQLNSRSGVHLDGCEGTTETPKSSGLVHVHTWPKSKPKTACCISNHRQFNIDHCPRSRCAFLC